MSDEKKSKAEKLQEMRAIMQAEGFERTGPAHQLKMDDITGGEEWVGEEGEKDETHALDVPGEAIEGICRTVWKNMVLTQEPTADVIQGAMIECALQGYAFGFLTAQQQVRREVKAKEEEKKDEAEPSTAP